VQRGLVGDIIKRFEQKGFKLVALKLTNPTDALLRKHYADLAARPFFPKLIGYMASGPVVCMVWEGRGAVKTGRQMLGATNPADSMPGTIRGDFCIEVGRNICHGSDRCGAASLARLLRGRACTGTARVDARREHARPAPVQRRERAEGDCALVPRGRHRVGVA
jgi:nucleoside-diphosphate kinase